MSQTTPNTVGPLTIVLMQGAFADASSLTGVIERLQKEGVQVTVHTNPLRGLSRDSADPPGGQAATQRPVAELAFSLVQTHPAGTSKHMKGIHHESKQALASRETPRSGSITH